MLFDVLVTGKAPGSADTASASGREDSALMFSQKKNATGKGIAKQQQQQQQRMNSAGFSPPQSWAASMPLQQSSYGGDLQGTSNGIGTGNGNGKESRGGTGLVASRGKAATISMFA